MTENLSIPDDFILTRTTDDFDAESVPAGLLRAHRVAEGVWGRVIVRSGVVTLVFEDSPEHPVIVEPATPGVIPPARPHHVELDADACFAVEFYRAP